MHRYTREELEAEIKQAWDSIRELKESYADLKIRTDRYKLDTARSASLTASMESIYDLRRRGKGGVMAIAAMIVEDRE